MDTDGRKWISCTVFSTVLSMAESSGLRGSASTQKKRHKKKKKTANPGFSSPPNNKDSCVGLCNFHCESRDVLPENELSTRSSFEEELAWCIRQLELGLLRDKVTSAQRNESEQLIRKLSSEKTPLPRKRQLMRTVFGDYRTAMKKSPLQSLPAVAEVAIESVKGKRLDEMGRFYRHRTETIGTKSENEFKFNFVVQ